MKKSSPNSTHKKAILLLLDRSLVHGYLNPNGLAASASVEILTREGEFQSLPLSKIKRIHFVREFADSLDEERKVFFSRPKLDGLWVRLRFRDGDVTEGIISSDLLDLLQNGLRLTPPDLNGNTLWIFIPPSAVTEIKVLGVVGVARRQPSRAASASAQPKLFEE